MQASITIMERSWVHCAFILFEATVGRYGVSFCRDKLSTVSGSNIISFHINLPFVNVANTIMMKQTFDGHGGFKSVPVVSGKIFGRKIKI